MCPCPAELPASNTDWLRAVVVAEVAGPWGRGLVVPPAEVVLRLTCRITLFFTNCINISKQYVYHFKNNRHKTYSGRRLGHAVTWGIGLATSCKRGLTWREKKNNALLRISILLYWVCNQEIIMVTCCTAAKLCSWALLICCCSMSCWKYWAAFGCLCSACRA